MKTKLRGFKKICAFAYVQSMKSKAMKITLAILCVIALLSMPLSTVISGIGDSGEEEQTTAIKKVHIYDNTDIIGTQFINKNIADDLYNDIEYIIETDKENIEEIINREDNTNEIFLVIEYCDDEMSLSYGINICAYYNSESEVSEEDANAYAIFIDENVKEAILKAADTSEEIITKVAKDIEYEVTLYDENGEPVDNGGISQFEYMFTYVFILMLIFMVSFAGSKVSELIVTEKSTRVMEYLLTSVKPMAVLLGKVIASTMMMLTILVTILVSFAGSILLNNIMFPLENGGFALPQALQGIIDSGELNAVTPVNIILAIAIILIGCLFYGLIAGVAGATVSKIEEMAEGMKLFTFTLMIGAYIPLFMAMSSSIGGEGWGNITNVIYLLPISSVFILPQYLLLGNVSAGLVLGAIGILVVSVVLLLLFVNRVYEHMLYSNGNTLTLKDIIGMAKKGKEEKNGK